MPVSTIKSKCRRCGKEAPSDSFILDPVYGMMVCQNCVNERRSKSFSVKKTGNVEDVKSDESPKPKGWDADDELLEKSYRQKIESYVKVQKIDSEKVKYTCPKCKYQFVYNLDKNLPSKCPYCNMAIQKFKF
ncbi:MAG: hypothetical protein QXG00_01915 [Candidatus Woesearchaeota archaeon]